MKNTPTSTTNKPNEEHGNKSNEEHANESNEEHANTSPSTDTIKHNNTNGYEEHANMSPSLSTSPTSSNTTANGSTQHERQRYNGYLHQPQRQPTPRAAAVKCRPPFRGGDNAHHASQTTSTTPGANMRPA